MVSLALASGWRDVPAYQGGLRVGDRCDATTATLKADEDATGQNSGTELDANVSWVFCEERSTAGTRRHFHGTDQLLWHN